MKRVLLFTIVLLFAAPVAAEQVEFGWRTLVEYDSDITAQDGGRDDVIFTFGPLTRIEGDYRRFDYSVEHFSAFEKYGEVEVLNGWRHELRAQGRYSISPRLRLTVSNDFQQLPQLRNGTIDDATVNLTEDEPGLNLTSGEVVTNVFSSMLTFTPVPRMAASSQVSVVYREFDNATLNSQNTISTSLQNQLTYQWNESHTFGGGFRYSTRDFETGVVGDLVDATTQTWEGFASWVWEIDARSTFNARLGPAFSSDDVDRGGPQTEFRKFPALVINFAGELVGAVRDPAGCPPENIRPGGIAFPEQCVALDQADDTGFGLGITGAALDTLLGLTTTLTPEDAEDASGDNSNLFFSFGIDRNWERLRVQGSWTRSDSQTQSLGSNTLVDSVNLESVYDLTPRMRFQGRFRYTRRTSDLDREILTLLMSDTLEVIPEIPAGGAGLMGAPIIGFSVEDGSFEQTQESFNLQFRLVRDIGASSSAFLGATMRRQITDLDSKIDFLDFETTIDSWQFSMGFTYRFRPIRF